MNKKIYYPVEITRGKIRTRFANAYESEQGAEKAIQDRVNDLQACKGVTVEQYAKGYWKKYKSSYGAQKVVNLTHKVTIQLSERKINIIYGFIAVDLLP